MNESYKVVELSTVTDESIEAALNEWTAAGYAFDGVHFAMREGSHRPAMAFMVFSKAPTTSPRSSGDRPGD